jgi:hypothetical protein
VLIQRAAHIFDMTKMQEFYIESFRDQQNIKSERDLEKLLAEQGMTMADLKTRLVEEFAPQQVIRAEVAERIAVSEKDARAYYEAHTADFDVPAQATVREIVIKAAIPTAKPSGRPRRPCARKWPGRNRLRRGRCRRLGCGYQEGGRFARHGQER